MKKNLLLLLFLLSISCSKDETIKEESPEVFTMSTSVSPPNGGSITGIEETYRNGDEVTLTAEPSENFVFKEWQGDFTGSENPLKFTMSSDKEVVAIFEEKVYSLDFDIVGKWYIRNSSTDDSSTAAKKLNKQSDNSNCAVTSIEFREDGTYILITSEGELSGQYVIIGNKSIDLGIGELENLSFINDVLTFTMNLDSGCSSDVSALLLTYVPDDAFEEELIKLGYDDKLDNFVKTKNISTVTELKLDIYNKVLKDLTGLESFQALEIIDISNLGALSSDYNLDLSHNKALRELKLFYLWIKKLDVTGNPNLEKLIVLDAALSEDLDLSKNPKLREIIISQNYQGLYPHGISIDFSNNPLLEKVDFETIDLGVLDFRENKNLKYLSIEEGVSEVLFKNTYSNMEYLGIGGSGLYYKEIDLSQFPNLTGLALNTNLNSLNLSNNDKLETLMLQAPNLESLDLSKAPLLYDFYLGQDNAITCIQASEEQLLKLENGDLEWSEGYNYSINCD